MKPPLNSQNSCLYIYIYLYLYIYIPFKGALSISPLNSRNSSPCIPKTEDQRLPGLAPAPVRPRLCQRPRVEAVWSSGARPAYDTPEDPKSRSTFGFCNLHHRSTRVQNWGMYFLDPRKCLGKDNSRKNIIRIRIVRTRRNNSSSSNNNINDDNSKNMKKGKGNSSIRRITITMTMIMTKIRGIVIIIIRRRIVTITITTI